MLPQGQVKTALILGAGAAGLAVARLLRSKGIEVTILEGRDRIGGRLYTKDGLDIGGHWIHGGGPDAEVPAYSEANIGPEQRAYHSRITRLRRSGGVVAVAVVAVRRTREEGVLMSVALSRKVPTSRKLHLAPLASSVRPTMNSNSNSSNSSRLCAQL